MGKLRERGNVGLKMLRLVFIWLFASMILVAAVLH